MRESKAVKELRVNLEKNGHMKFSFDAKPIIPDRLMVNQKPGFADKDIIHFREVLRNYRSLLASTELINFKCDFDATTGCRRDRRRHGSGLNPYHPKKVMCCCSGCAGSGGWFHDELMCSREEFKYYTRRWHPYLGFWRPNKGCILDRDKRSITCIFFNCLSSSKNEENKKESNLIYGFEDATRYLYSRLKKMLTIERMGK